MNSVTDLVDAVRAAGASRRTLEIRGGGSKVFYGRPAVGEPLDVRGHAGIVAYEPSELVVTARCGTRLAELESALAERGQMLAFEPPRCADSTTVGGMLMAGLSGPRQAYSGPLRHFVLGAKLLDGRGEVLTFGGQVMKNVAGYDVSRLLAGSMGTLGILLEVSLKTQPLPPCEETLQFEFPEDRALESMRRWAALPLPISATCWRGDVLFVRLSGAAPALTAARDRLGGERVMADVAHVFWRNIRDHTDAFFRQSPRLWRLSLPATTPREALQDLVEADRQLIECGGAVRWLACGTTASAIRAVAAKVGGHATLFRASDEERGREGVFQPLSAPMLALHRRLKTGFDPLGIFNPGRLYAEF